MKIPGSRKREKRHQKVLNEYFSDIPTKYRTEYVRCKLYEEYHVSDIVLEESNYLADFINEQIEKCFPNDFNLFYQCKMFQSGFNVVLKYTDYKENVQFPYFLERTDDPNTTTNIGSINLTYVRGMILPKKELFRILVHELTHAFQIYKIRQSYNYSKRGRKTLDKQSLIRIQQNLIGFMNDHRLLPEYHIENYYSENNIMAMFVDLYNLIYFTSNSEFQAYSHELYSEVQNNPSKYKFVEETDVYKHVVVQSKEMLLKWKKFLLMIPNNETTIRSYTPEFNKLFFVMIEEVFETDYKGFKEYITDLETTLSKIEYRFRTIFWRLRKK